MQLIAFDVGDDFVVEADLDVFVVVEVGKGLQIGKGRLKKRGDDQKEGKGVRLCRLGLLTVPAQAANQAYFSIIAIMALNASSSEKYVLINSKISSPLLPLL